MKWNRKALLERPLTESCPYAGRDGLSTSPTTLLYDGFQSPAAGPASGRVSPESHDAIATISAWS